MSARAGFGRARMVTPFLALCGVALVGAALAFGAAAVEPAAPEQSPATVDPAGEQARREEALRALERTARGSAESRQSLDREIAGLKADGPKLAAALVATAHRARAAEERARSLETRLDELLAKEAGIRNSLEARRETLADVLGALQRMGRHPAPALLVRPGDVLDAVRAAMLLGAVTPTLREEARVLSAELAELLRLRTAIAADRAVLDQEYAALAAERDRLGALVRARQDRLAGAEVDMRRERSRTEALGQEARGLRDLIDRMEAESARARSREAEARAGAEAEARALRERFAAAALRDPVRLAPRQSVPELRGSLARPATGPVLRAFGTPDGSGGTMRGSAIATRARAAVTAPVDGTVVFAGPFRAYGRLLIIDAGGGYYFLLAGMDVIQVEVGQFVLGGEPVAQMGEVAAPSAALGVVEATGPVLYVELRKDGGPIDPSPWWAKSQSERARG